MMACLIVLYESKRERESEYPPAVFDTSLTHTIKHPYKEIGGGWSEERGAKLSSFLLNRHFKKTLRPKCTNLLHVVKLKTDSFIV